MSRRLSRTTRTAVLRIGALLAAASMVLAGCAIPLPTVEADPPLEGPQPALDEVRLDRVLDAVAEAIAAGDDSEDAADFGTRVAGPAKHTRQAEYALAEATADSDDPTGVQQLTTDPEVTVMSSSDTWPKQIFVFTTIADGMNTPLLISLEQKNPRADYRLLTWVRLLPEITTPETALPAEGSAQLAADASGLLLSPQETVDGYADLLAKGDDSDVADDFADDIFRDFILEDRETLKDSVADAGEYSETFTSADFAPRTLETADGGAIVVGAMQSRQKYERTIEDSEMTIGGNIALLNGTDSIEVDSLVTAGYYFMVAFYVPPEGSEDPIQVLGAERVLDSVTTE